MSIFCSVRAETNTTVQVSMLLKSFYTETEFEKKAEKSNKGLAVTQGSLNVQGCTRLYHCFMPSWEVIGRG